MWKLFVMALNVLTVFAGIGAIICIGFLGSLLFEKTKVPDILILIFIGLLIGPILTNYLGGTAADQLIPQSYLTTIAPYFAALALVIILFDGGLNLNLDKVMSQLGITILHTGIGFMGTMFATAIICYFILGITNITIGLLLGCIIGGISSAVVLPIMAGVNAKEDTKTILSLESVLSDVLCIVTALILIEILKGGATDTGGIIQDLLSTFILAGFIGLLFGIAWLMVLKKVHGKPFSFMITIAALLILYSAVEYIQVSGAIAALVFGLVLSNKDEFKRMFKLKIDFVFDEQIKEFHSEVSFVIRTFFFVYLGLTFTLSLDFAGLSFVPQYPFDLLIPEWIWGIGMYMFIIALFVVFLGLFVVRYIGATVTTAIKKDIKEDKSFLYAMIPRGLAAAVLAALPFTIPEFTDAILNPEYFNAIAMYEDLFLNMAFMLIVITVVATTIGIFFIERSKANAEPEKDGKEPEKDWTQKSRMWKKHTSDIEKPSEKKHVDDWKTTRRSKPKDDVVRVHSQSSTPVKKTMVKSTYSSPSQRAPFPKSESRFPIKKTASKPIKQPAKKATPPPKPVKRVLSPLEKRAEQAKKKPPVKKA